MSLFSKKKVDILVVDDSPTVVEMVTSILKVYYSVAKAANGSEAIQKAVNLSPSVMILDARMPDLDGWEVCEILKNTSKTKKIKVIMCTGASKGKEVEKAFSAGADGYIIKPVESGKLLEKIGSLI